MSPRAQIGATLTSGPHQSERPSVGDPRALTTVRPSGSYPDTVVIALAAFIRAADAHRRSRLALLEHDAR